MIPQKFQFSLPSHHFSRYVHEVTPVFFITSTSKLIIATVECLYLVSRLKEKPEMSFLIIFLKGTSSFES